MSEHAISLRIFDQTISVDEISPSLLNVLKEMYGRFLQSETSISQPSVGLPNKQQFSVTSYDTSDENISAFDINRLLRAYAANVRTHLLIHAGVLSVNEEGILIVAPTMHGKTTLTLKLLRQGFCFLSDDIAPIGVADHLVHPFPRSLVVRSGSLSMAGFPPLPADTPTWLGKQIIDCEALSPGCLGVAVPIRHVFFLQDSSVTEPHITPTDSQGIPSCGLLLSTLPGELLDEIKKLAGIAKLVVKEFDEQPYLTIYAQNRPAVLQQIEALCLEREVDLFHLAYRTAHRPNFSNPVQIERYSQSDATMLLLQQFLGGYHSVLFKEEMGNSPIRLSMLLANMIKDANCYRLSTGPLQDMANAVCTVVGYEAPTKSEQDLVAISI